MNIHSVSSRVNIRSHQVSTRMSIIPSRLLMWEFYLWTFIFGKCVEKADVIKMIIEYICDLGEVISLNTFIISYGICVLRPQIEKV